MKHDFLAVGLLVLLTLSACGGQQATRDKYLSRGIELFNSNDHIKARLEFRNSIQIDPKFADGYYWFARTEELDQNWRKAFALFTRALELDSQHKDARLRLGRIYILGGDAEKALEAAETVLKEYKGDMDALVLKGLAQARLGETENAVEVAKKVLARVPDNLDALSLVAALFVRNGQISDAVQLVRPSWERNKDDIALNLLLARLLEKQKDTAAVSKIYRRLVASKPKDTAYRLNYFRYLVRSEQLEAAFKTMAEAIQAINDPLLIKEWVGFLREYYPEEMQARIAAQSDVMPENGSLLLELASTQSHAKEYQKAASTYQKIFDGDFDADVNLKAELGLSLNAMLQGGYQEALTMVDKVLGDDPKNKEGLIIRANIALRLEDPDQGIADLRVLLREYPASVRAYRLKARAHMKKGEVQLALQSLEKAISIKPAEIAANFDMAALLIQSGKQADAIGIFGKLLKYVPDHEQTLVTLAGIHRQRKDWEGLMEVSGSLRRYYPDKPLGYFFKGLALSGLERYNEAIDTFDRTLRKQPNAIEPLVAKAETLVRLNRAGEALSVVDKVIQADTEHFTAANLKGEILLNQNQVAAAAEQFDKVIKLEPEWPVGYRNLAKTWLRRSESKKVLEVLKQGYKNTGNSTLGIELAILYDREGASEEAANLYREMLSNASDLALAANNLAMILTRHETDPKALSEALNLVEEFFESSNAVFLDTLGWVLFLNGKVDRAETVLVKAVLQDESIPDIQYHLGRIYVETGKKKKARIALEKALKSNREFRDRGQAQKLLTSLEG